MFLGLATVLLFYLAWPGRKRKISRREGPAYRPAEVRPREHLEEVQTQRQTNRAADGKKEMAGPI
jgi:hypothetical protein